MNRLIIVSYIFSFGFLLKGQQEAQFSQPMFNRIYFNPGAVGLEESTVFTAVMRQQWIGINGAPAAQFAGADIPMLNQRLGLGFNITRMSYGISNNLTANALYAYRFKMAGGTLGVGTQVSFRYLENDYSDGNIKATQDRNIDFQIPQGVQSKLYPNFGVGLFYNSPTFFLGFSIPRLIESNIDFSDRQDFISQESRNFYFNTGYRWEVSEGFGLTPQALVKFTKNSPLDADAYLMADWNKKLFIGAGYSLGGDANSSIGESFTGIIGFTIAKKLQFSISYDYSTSQLRSLNQGSVEGCLKYFLHRSETKTMVDPRFEE
jgi:type IX secretion system PorP/SprF family membrane protein